MKLFTVNGKPRGCRADLWLSLRGPKPADDWRDCDGCTASPDYWRGVALWPACRIHDWHCRTGVVGRVRADLTFRINIWRCLRYGKAPLWRALGVAALYWLGVRGGSVLGIGAPKDDARRAA